MLYPFTSVSRRTVRSRYVASRLHAYALSNRLHACIEPLPIIAEQRPVESPQPVARASVHRDVELRHGGRAADFRGELRVGDEEGGGVVSREEAGKALLVEEIDEVGDVGIHDGLADQRQCAVLQLQRLVDTLRKHSFAPCELFDELLR